VGRGVFCGGSRGIVLGNFKNPARQNGEQLSQYLVGELSKASTTRQEEVKEGHMRREIGGIGHVPGKRREESEMRVPRRRVPQLRYLPFSRAAGTGTQENPP